MSHNEQVPTINVVSSEGNNPSGPTRSPSDPSHASHSRSPSDPSLLVPRSPLSPTGPADDAPPSPQSVRFEQHTSKDLRDSNPGDGMSSLAALEPNGRKASAVSLSAVSAQETIPDAPLPSTNTSETAASKSKRDSKSKKKKGKKGDGDEDDDGNDEKKDPLASAHIDPSQDNTDPTPFTHKPLVLAALFDPKNLKDLRDLGGVEAVIKGLGTDRQKGLSNHSLGQAAGDEEKSGGEASFGASLADRQRVYGVNALPRKKSKSLLQLMWIAFQDRILLLLAVAAVISLALGLYQDFGVEHGPVPCPTREEPDKTCEHTPLDFVEGVAIVIAILIVVLVGSLNDWQKERQFRSLNEKKDDRTVKVIRAGKEQQINIKDVLVGDLALLEPGEIIPCDGIFVSGHNVRADESGATGESDAIKKFAYEDCAAELAEKGETKKDPFILSGSKILEGVGSYIVVAVGPRSFNGRIMMALSGDTESTPLQVKLNHLAEVIAKIGGVCGLTLFTALMIKFFVHLRTKPNRTGTEKAQNFAQILIISITLVVVAVPEGLPLAVTLALAFATKRMTYEKLLVRVLGSCETMANATVVCTDKTGTLTQNVMSVVAGSVGVRGKFVANLEENSKRTNADKERKHQDFSLDQADLNKVVSPQLARLFNENIAVNSTAFEDVNRETGEIEFVGSKTETALLRFAKDLGWRPYKETREAANVVQLLPFASERKYMGVMVKLPNGKFRVYFKGASEILTRVCTHHVVVSEDAGSRGGDENAEVEIDSIDELKKENIANTIIFYANQMLRTIALAYRDVDSWPPANKSTDDAPLSDLADGLTLIGIVGIEDPLRPNVREAVKDCDRAGVTVKMCTGDNVLTARSIASQCGIYGPGGLIMEGPVFRKLTPVEREQVVPRLQVLARSSPEDKKILVETLKGQGQVVGVTGDGTNDGPALKTANVGFSMGIAGTEVAKEASDIILMDDNFGSIVSAIMWGRCVNDSVRKFLQFQISVNITAVLITFISAVASDDEQSVLTAVQLLWINIIMDTFAALALATDRATRSMLDRKPDPKSAPLFTIDMGKMIIGQAIFQTICILVFYFAGPSIYGIGNNARLEAELKATTFNIFVFCQIFNSVNCRRIDNKYNFLEGITKNPYFTIITLFEVAMQVVIIYFGGAAFSVVRITGRDWGISIALGSLAIPIGAIIRTIPNGPIRRFLVDFRIMQDPNALPVVAERDDKYHQAIEQVRDNLSTFRQIRGGRIGASGLMRRKSRAAQLEKAGVRLPDLLAMVPTLVGTSVGAGWAERDKAGLQDPANSGDPSKSSAALWEGKVQLHPETDPEDPAYKIWGRQLEKPTKLED